VRSDGDAVDGEFIVVPDGTGTRRGGIPNEGRAAYTFEVPADGEYALWGRTRAQSNGNSVYVVVDGGSSVYWAAPITNDWTWTELGRFYQGETETLSLSAGTHTVEVVWREDGMRLDRLLLADPGYEPSGDGPS
jgi:hypothetical protein